MKVKITAIAICALLFIALLILFTRQSQKPQEVPSKQEANKVTINKESLNKEELDKRIKQAQYFQNWLAQQKTSAPGVPLTTDEIQNTMLDERIIETYAKEHDIIVSDEEVNKRYAQAAASIGTEQEYLAKMQKIRGFTKEIILANIRKEILAEKVSQAVNKPLAIFLEEQRAYYGL